MGSARSAFDVLTTNHRAGANRFVRNSVWLYVDRVISVIQDQWLCILPFPSRLVQV
jgi:hypothetical protein